MLKAPFQKLIQGYIGLRLWQMIILSLLISTALFLLIHSSITALSLDPRDYPIRLHHVYDLSSRKIMNFGSRFTNDSTRVAVFTGTGPDGVSIGTFDRTRTVEYSVHHEDGFFDRSYPDNTLVDVDGDGLDELLLSFAFGVTVEPVNRIITDADSVVLAYYGMDDRRITIEENSKPDSIEGKWNLIYSPVRRSNLNKLDTENTFVLSEHGKGEIYSHNQMFIYRKGSPPILTVKLPPGPPTIRGIVTTNKSGDYLYTLGISGVDQGSYYLPPSNPVSQDASVDTVRDSRGGVIQFDETGRIRWTKSLGQGGGETYVYADPNREDGLLVIFNQDRFLPEYAEQGCFIYHMSLSTGQIMDSTRYDGFFHPFTGHNADHLEYVGLLSEFKDDKTSLITLDGQKRHTYLSNTRRLQNHSVPVLRTDKGDYVYASSEQSNHTILRNMDNKPVGVYPMVGRLRLASYGTYSDYEDRLILRTPTSIVEVSPVTVGFPRWWFRHNRWYFLLFLVPLLVLIGLYYYLRFRDSRLQAMKRLKEEVQERTREYREANEELTITSAYLESVFNAANDGIFTVDRKLTVVRANKSFCRLVSVPAFDIEGHALESIEHEGIDTAIPLIKQVLSERKEIKNAYVEYGLNRVIKMDALPLELSDRKLIQVLVTVRDVSRQFQTRLRSAFSGYGDLIGNSVPMQEVFNLLENLKSMTSTVLIFGESGTGKELVARAIHDKSGRSDGPFITVNCASIDKNLQKSELFGHVKGAFTGATNNHIGYFEQADGGTLFLDELGDLALDVQARLLRVLESGEVQRLGEERLRWCNVRIIAATNKNLSLMMKRHEFREDLFHRLNVVQIHMPPLRERESDIELLTRHFVEFFSSQMGKSPVKISDGVLELFNTYSWPGNVRELRNTIEHAILFCEDDVLDVQHLREDIRRGMVLQSRGNGQDAVSIDGDEFKPLPSKEWTREYLLEVLETVRWNKRKAASILDVSPQTLYNHLKKYSIN